MTDDSTTTGKRKSPEETADTAATKRSHGANSDTIMDEDTDTSMKESEQSQEDLMNIAEAEWKRQLEELDTTQDTPNTPETADMDIDLSAKPTSSLALAAAQTRSPNDEPESHGETPENEETTDIEIAQSEDEGAGKKITSEQTDGETRRTKGKPTYSEVAEKAKDVEAPAEPEVDYTPRRLLVTVNIGMPKDAIQRGEFLTDQLNLFLDLARKCSQKNLRVIKYSENRPIAERNNRIGPPYLVCPRILLVAISKRWCL